MGVKKMSNKAIGNKLEEDVCQVFGMYHWWCTNLAQGRTGQPADIIACKYGESVLLDAKHCQAKYFDTRRMETNQIYSMTRWLEAYNGYCGFVLEFSSCPGVYWVVPFVYLHSRIPHRVSMDEVMQHGEMLEVFIRKRLAKYEN